VCAVDVDRLVWMFDIDRLVLMFAMGWLRLVDSLKLQVTSAEYSLFYRALLQKRPLILRSQLIVATPYVGNVAG